MNESALCLSHSGFAWAEHNIGAVVAIVVAAAAADKIEWNSFRNTCLVDIGQHDHWFTVKSTRRSNYF